MKKLNQVAWTHRRKAGSKDVVFARPRPFRVTFAHGLFAHSAPAGMDGEPVDQLAPGHAVRPRQSIKGASA
jgi:hypothetical protein